MHAPGQVSELRARFPNKDIQVDGGVGPKTIQPCAEAGACCCFALCYDIGQLCIGSNVIVSGTAVFGAHDPSQAMEEMRSAVKACQASWPTKAKA
jgi:ribulose-phosphate 3-epimerase